LSVVLDGQCLEVQAYWADEDLSHGSAHRDRRQALRPASSRRSSLTEWTSAPNNRNMRRNVFFKDSKKVPTLPSSGPDDTTKPDVGHEMDLSLRAGALKETIR
jgi:hypothetical protein